MYRRYLYECLCRKKSEFHLYFFWPILREMLKLKMRHDFLPFLIVSARLLLVHHSLAKESNTPWTEQLNTRYKSKTPRHRKPFIIFLSATVRVLLKLISDIRWRLPNLNSNSKYSLKSEQKFENLHACLIYYEILEQWLVNI
jgi:hypothetical protein